jgi:HSP20 family protein
MARETTPAPRQERSGVPTSWYADPFESLRTEMNSLFDGFFGRGTSILPRAWGEGFPGAVVPRIDVRETDKQLTIEAELPGLDEKDIKVTLQNGLLTIRGEKSFEKKDEKADYHVMERRYGSFHRAMRVPDAIDEARIEAKFDKGVLTVTLPKRPEAVAKERQIEVRRG